MTGCRQLAGDNRRGALSCIRAGGIRIGLRRRGACVLEHEVLIVIQVVEHQHVRAALARSASRRGRAAKTRTAKETCAGTKVCAAGESRIGTDTAGLGRTGVTRAALSQLCQCRKSKGQTSGNARRCNGFGGKKHRKEGK